MNTNTKKFQRSMTQAFLALMIMLAAAGSVAFAPEAASAYIVQAASFSTAADLVSAYGGEVDTALPIINGVSAQLSDSEFAALKNNPEIVAITKDHQVKVSAYELTGNTADGKTSTDYPEVSGADVVWDEGITGAGVTVAVLDTGIAKLPSLVKAADNHTRLLGWFDAVDGGKKPIDPNGHGSHVAGIIANSDLGGDGAWNGIAPNADLVAVRVLNAEGYGTYESVISGLQWVVENKNKYNIRVVNMSLVSSVESPYWADPLNQAVSAAWSNGLVVVTAAGNDGPTPLSITVPGNNPYVITVGAFTDAYTPEDWSDDYIADFSAAGPTLDGFVKPDLVAPGGHISSITPQAAVLNNLYPDNRQPANYFKMAGTSQATGVVSGVAALILQRNPGMTNNEVKFRLTNTALIWLDAEAIDASYSMWQQGAGRLNAVDAVFSREGGSANEGMDVLADIAGTEHYEGYSYYDAESDTIRLLEPFDFITGKYGIWDGNYEAATGKYGIWDGQSLAWAGQYGITSAKYGIWAGKYGIWDGKKGIWDGKKGIWDGKKGIWDGKKGIWDGKKGIWDGGYTGWFSEDVLAAKKGIWDGKKGIWDGKKGIWDGTFMQAFAAGMPPSDTVGSATISNYILGQ